MIVPFRGEEDYAREAEGVAAYLVRGGLIAYPTETVYGLGCALLGEPLGRLAALKAREPAKPFLLLVLDARQAGGLVWSDAARRLAAVFWPGPLTLALRAARAFPERVLGPGGTVAVRATPHPGIRAILGALGGPITSTSANLPGEPPAADVERVLQVIDALGARGEFRVLDGGRLPESPPSTIVDCSGTRPRILRVGAVPPDALREALDEIHG